MSTPAIQRGFGLWLVAALAAAALAFFGLHRGLGPPGDTQRPPERLGSVGPQAVTALLLDGDTLRVGDAAGRVFALDLMSGEARGHFVAHDGVVRRLLLASGQTGLETVDAGVAGGPRLVTVGADGTVAEFTLDGAPLGRARLPDARLNDAALRAGAVFVAADQGLVARLGSAETAWRLPALHGKAAFAVALSPDGAMLASGGSDGWVRLTSAGTGEVAVAFEARSPWITHLRWTPEGLWTFGSDGQFARWSVTAEGYIHDRTVSGHAGPIVAVDLDDAALLTGSEDGTARLWDRQTAAPRALFEAGAPVRSVALGPQAVYIGTIDGLLRRFPRAGGAAAQTYSLTPSTGRP